GVVLARGEGGLPRPLLEGERGRHVRRDPPALPAPERPHGAPARPRVPPPDRRRPRDRGPRDQPRAADLVARRRPPRHRPPPPPPVAAEAPVAVSAAAASGSTAVTAKLPLSALPPPPGSGSDGDPPPPPGRPRLPRFVTRSLRPVFALLVTACAVLCAWSIWQ